MIYVQAGGRFEAVGGGAADETPRTTRIDLPDVGLIVGKLRRESIHHSEDLWKGQLGLLGSDGESWSVSICSY